MSYFDEEETVRRTQMRPVDGYTVGYTVARSATPEFANGQRVRLIDALGGGHATVIDTYRTGIYQVRLGNGVEVAVDNHALRRAAPIWKPGDVIVVRFAASLPSYTYVRGARNWPGDNRPAKTDHDVDMWYAGGKVTPVLQAGGEPFDKGRL